MNQKIAILIAVAVSVAATAGIMQAVDPDQITQVLTDTRHKAIYVESDSEYFKGTQEIKKISSQGELKEIIKASLLVGKYDMNNRVALDRSIVTRASPEMEPMSEVERVVPSAAYQAGGSDYSTTNIQVADVDEPDYLKNDSKYVYIVSGNALSIIDAYPAESARLILKIALDVETQHIQNMFLNGDRLVVFYNGQKDTEIIPQYDFVPRKSHEPVTHALIIDVSDRENPRILKDYYIDGRFKDARMIGNYTYFVTGNSIDRQHPELPVVMERSVQVETSDVFYFDNMEPLSNFNTLTVVDIFGDTVISETFLMGHTGTFYVSEDSFYLTYEQNTQLQFHESFSRDRFFGVIVPLLPDSIQNKIKAIRDSGDDADVQWAKISEILQKSYNAMGKEDRKKMFEEIKDALAKHDAKKQADKTRTVIHKISIDGDKIEYAASGSVSGWLLNQFSMDQDGDRLRVATTTEHYTQNHIVLANAVHVLDGQLNTVGKLDNIAPNETIFSSRFIGDRLYLVTFEQIDPFFVIDLSTDTPKVLGELKIPGFSNYLHPYDEGHIIGIGRDTSVEKGWVGEGGIKIALFNVADVSNPMVADDVIIGDGLAYSETLSNHKAFFFDKKRGIMSIPISGDTGSLDEISGDVGGQDGGWSGFYVFDIDRLDGFSLRGTITHSDYEWSYGIENSRTFHIDDVLYTASWKYLKMNMIDDLGEINSIRLKGTGKFIDYLE